MWSIRLGTGAALALTMAVPAAGQTDGASLGSVDFDVACDSAVTVEFDRAVAYLHHMQYVEARGAFERIAARDPACGMAHWGVAMTLFQPLWPVRPSPADLERGWEAVETARGLGTDAARDAALVEAAAAFYRDPATAAWETRLDRWHAAMTTAHADHADDLETAAFYALSRLSAVAGAAQRAEAHAEAAAILRDVYRQSPDHPGAIHYTIHANDVTGRERETLEIVERYDDIAPAVPHALHMPTHIYIRLGAWDQVIRWNERSAAAALEYPAGDRVSHHYAHALDYQIYAHLQLGDDTTARAVLETATPLREPLQGTFINAFHLAAMPARLVVERRDWPAAAALQPRQPPELAWDRFWWAESLSWSARGLGAVHAGSGDVGAALDRLAVLRDEAAAAGEAGFARSIEVDRLVLASWDALSERRASEAIAHGEEAVRLDEAGEKHPVTPGAIYPPQESLGDLLLRAGQPAEALAAYESGLRRWPGRFNSHVGAARAAAAAGNPDAARRHARAVLALSADVPAPRPEVAEMALLASR